MSYNAYVTGLIEIDPPLPWHLFKDSVWRRGSEQFNLARTSPEVEIQVVEASKETDDGEIITRTGVAIIPSRAEQGAHTLAEEVTKIVDEFGAGRTFRGFLHVRGEETAQWRIRVNPSNGLGEEIHPRLVWPDDEEVPL